jgi:hypothetical protein
VLDVLVFRRAQARFLTSSLAASGAGAATLPWREPDLEGFPLAAGRGPAGADGGPGGGAEHATNGVPIVPPPSAAGRGPRDSDPAARPPSGPRDSDPPARPPSDPSRPAEQRRDPAPAERARPEPPPRQLRYRQPFVPALAPPPAPTARANPSTAPVMARPTAAPAVEPVAPPVEPQPVAAYPFAAPSVRSHAIAIERERSAGAASREDSGRALDGPHRAAERTATPTELPWPEPRPASTLRVEPGAVGPFVPSPARSAAATAERVARLLSAREPRDHAVLPSPSARARPQERERPQRSRNVTAPLTTSGLLREVTRDEVVRALAARMRALAHEDRFRLGELR